MTPERIAEIAAARDLDLKHDREATAAPWKQWRECDQFDNSREILCVESYDYDAIAIGSVHANICDDPEGNAELVIHLRNTLRARCDMITELLQERDALRIAAAQAERERIVKMLKDIAATMTQDETARTCAAGLLTAAHMVANYRVEPKAADLIAAEKIGGAE